MDLGRPNSDIIQLLLNVSGRADIDDAIPFLIDMAKNPNNHEYLQIILPNTITLCNLSHNLADMSTVTQTLKLIRNLCASESSNGAYFIQEKGVDVLYGIINSQDILDAGLVTLIMQVFSNVCLSEKANHGPIWIKLYPHTLMSLLQMRTKAILSPVSNLLNSCIAYSPLMVHKICYEADFIVELLRTACAVDFEEESVDYIISKISLEYPYFNRIFQKLAPDPTQNGHVSIFSSQQRYLLSKIAKFVKVKRSELQINWRFPNEVLSLVRLAFSRLVNISPTDIECLKNLMEILRGISGLDQVTMNRGIRPFPAFDQHHGNLTKADIIQNLIREGLIELFLHTLLIMRLDGHENDHVNCPYQGFKCDLITTVANCCNEREEAQQKVREQNGLYLVLLHSTGIEELENPGIKECCIWASRAILTNNPENQQMVQEAFGQF